MKNLITFTVLPKHLKTTHLLEQAIRTYAKKALLTPDQRSKYSIARIYGDQGNIEQMFANYIEYIAYKPNLLNNTKRSIMSDFISENNANESNRILKTIVVEKNTKQPNPYWYDILSWLYVQERHTINHLFQEKAFIEGNPESLDRIIELAVTAITITDKTASAILSLISFAKLLKPIYSY